ILGSHRDVLQHRQAQLCSQGVGRKGAGILSGELPHYETGKIIWDHILKNAGPNPMSLAAHIAPEQRCQDTADGCLAGPPCTDLHGAVSGPSSIHLAFETRHPARFRGDDALVASDVAKRTFLAPSADRGINDPRVYSGKRRIVDPEPIRDAWPKG